LSCKFDVIAVAANIQKILDSQDCSTITFALVSLNLPFATVACPCLLREPVEKFVLWDVS